MKANIMDGVIIFGCFAVLYVVALICSFVHDKMVEYKIMEKEQEWISCKDSLPKKDCCYITTVKYQNGMRRVKMSYFVSGDFLDYYVIAWKKKPRTYKGD